MQDQQQFEQLMLQYNQLKTGSIEIQRLIDNEDYDRAFTMLKLREPIFLNCKCVRKFLELTPEQEKELNILLDEIRELEIGNIRKMQESMDEVKKELRFAAKNEKIQQAYDFNVNNSGNIINYSE